MKIVFAGTPEFAAQHLQSVIDSEFELVGVYTQPDRPAGRGKQLKASPVKELALKHNIPVFQPATLKNESDQQTLAELKPDLMIVVAYGLLLPQAVLDIPRLGCINVHASILPRWRGAAPIQRAIEAGDQESGVTIMQMEAGLDTGPMLKIASCDISDSETAGSLHDKLAELGQGALIDTLRELAEGKVIAEKQDDELANYAKKIDKSEAEIDWTEPAAVINRKIRAFNPFPTCYSALGEMRVKLQQAVLLDTVPTKPPGTIVQADSNGIVVACGEGQLSLQQMQLPGKKSMPVADVLNGKAEAFAVGQQFNV